MDCLSTDCGSGFRRSAFFWNFQAISQNLRYSNFIIHFVGLIYLIYLRLNNLYCFGVYDFRTISPARRVYCLNFWSLRGTYSLEMISAMFWSTFGILTNYCWEFFNEFPGINNIMYCFFFCVTHQLHVLNNTNPQILYDVCISNQSIWISVFPYFRITPDIKYAYRCLFFLMQSSKCIAVAHYSTYHFKNTPQTFLNFFT